MDYRIQCSSMVSSSETGSLNSRLAHVLHVTEFIYQMYPCSAHGELQCKVNSPADSDLQTKFRWIPQG